METSNNESIAPEWININFFEKVLKNYYCDKNLKVINIDIKPATKVGDHFASIMFRVKIIYSIKNINQPQLSLIVKTRPFQDGIKKDFLEKSAIFDIEMKMYTKTIPEMERLLKIADDSTIIAPKMFYCSKEPNDVIVFEDISQTGYALKDSALNFELSKSVFQLIAKWHGCSIFMKENNHDFSTYDVNIFNGFETINFLIGNLEAFPEIIKTWKGYEIYYDKFIKFKKNFIKNGLKRFAANCPQSGYNVLNHGDFHIKNMMFKKCNQTGRNNQNEDVIFFDFQICNWASPAIDLIYGLYIVCDVQCREIHRTELITIYYQTFVKTLKNIGFMGKIPTMLDLQIELLKCGFIEAMISFCFLPYQFMNLKKNDLIALNKNCFDIRKFGLSNPECQNMLKKYLRQFALKGFLD